MGDVDQRIREAQEKFNEGMGARGDASPYPLLRELRAQAAVHPGWPEMGVPEVAGDGRKTYTAYSFDAVKAVFTDNVTFSTRCCEDVVRPLQARRFWRCRSRSTRCTGGCTSLPSPARR